MRLFSSLFRIGKPKIRLPEGFKGPKGNIFRGKYRLVKKVTSGSVKDLTELIKIEENNMLLLRHPYITLYFGTARCVCVVVLLVACQEVLRNMYKLSKLTVNRSPPTKLAMTEQSYGHAKELEKNKKWHATKVAERERVFTEKPNRNRTLVNFISHLRINEDWDKIPS